MIVDNASPDVIAQTEQEHTHYVRLYFRPKRQPNIVMMEYVQNSARVGGAHCPIPIYFCFNSESILSKDDSEYSDGNMGSPRAVHSGEQNFFFQIPFNQVFHTVHFIADEHDEIIFRRNAEVLIPISITPGTRFKIYSMPKCS